MTTTRYFEMAISQCSKEELQIMVDTHNCYVIACNKPSKTTGFEVKIIFFSSEVGRFILSTLIQGHVQSLRFRPVSSNDDIYVIIEVSAITKEYIRKTYLTETSSEG